MSCGKRCDNLQDALRLAYAGPKAAERLAHDGGVSLRSAHSALAGHYPRAWVRFLRLIEKTPTILAHALATSWADELAVRREIDETRRRLDDMEARLAKVPTVVRAAPQPLRGMAGAKK